MKRFGLYLSHSPSNEKSEYIAIVDMFNIEQAEAYFAGMKQLSLEDFRKTFLIKEIKQSTKKLLFGNE